MMPMAANHGSTLGLMRPSVLLFGGLDPSGGAGIGADIEAVSANGAHPLSIITALTVQDNNRVHEVQPVDASLIARQALQLAACMRQCAGSQPAGSGIHRNRRL